MHSRSSVPQNTLRDSYMGKQSSFNLSGVAILHVGHGLPMQLAGKGIYCNIFMCCCILVSTGGVDWNLFTCYCRHQTLCLHVFCALRCWAVHAYMVDTPVISKGGMQ